MYISYAIRRRIGITMRCDGSDQHGHFSMTTNQSARLNARHTTMTSVWRQCSISLSLLVCLFLTPVPPALCPVSVSIPFSPGSGSVPLFRRSGTSGSRFLRFLIPGGPFFRRLRGISDSDPRSVFLFLHFRVRSESFFFRFRTLGVPIQHNFGLQGTVSDSEGSLL